jgi:CRP-like cAMP-binding protein
MLAREVPQSVASPDGVLVAEEGALLRGLRPDAVRRRYRRGEAIFLQGDISDRLFILEQGFVKICRSAPTGQEVVLGVRGAGDVVGELSTIDGQPRSANAVALGAVEARVLGAREFNDALDADPATARELLRLLAARLRDADYKRVEFATLPTIARVAGRLLELCERFGEQTGEGVRVEVPLSQEELAGWCGSSREATVKALKSLRDLELVTTGRRTVLVRNPDALRLHAQTPPA